MRLSSIPNFLCLAHLNHIVIESHFYRAFILFVYIFYHDYIHLFFLNHLISAFLSVSQTKKEKICIDYHTEGSRNFAKSKLNSIWRNKLVNCTLFLESMRVKCYQICSKFITAKVPLYTVRMSLSSVRHNASQVTTGSP